ncbi:MAG TPA: carboxypeptidase-like regulatory domain-containing protein [Gemmatimonadales bacterium]|nr:carboxypeptidase-like regulatory domain-containing protein [Gemmatimonadales bacterium]
MNRVAAVLLLSWAVAPAVLVAQGGGLAVLVMDQDSRPIEGAQGIVDRLIATTGADGMMYFPGLAPGQYQLTTRSVGFRWAVRQVGVTGQQTTRVIVKLEMAAVALPPVIVNAVRPGLYGTVSNTRLEPLVDAEVRLIGRRGRTIRTDSAGRFSYPEATGAYLVRFSANGHEQGRFGVTIPSEGGQEMLVQLRDNPWDEGPSNLQRANERRMTTLISWSNRRDVLTRLDLLQYGTMSLCEVPAIRGAIRRVEIGGGFTQLETCLIRASEVELVVWGPNSCFIPSQYEPVSFEARYARMRVTFGVSETVRLAARARQGTRNCPPYMAIFTGQ